MKTKRRNLLYNKELKKLSRELRKNPTPAEKKIWHECLREFKYNVARQKPIGRYIVDFYCARLKLIIEIDGESHYTEEGKEKDEGRRKIFKKMGLREIRFINSEIMNNIGGVWEVINRIEGEESSSG